MIAIDRVTRRLSDYFETGKQPETARLQKTFVAATVVDFAKNTADTFKHAKRRTQATIATSILAPVLAVSGCTTGNTLHEANSPTPKPEHSLIVPSPNRSTNVTSSPTTSETSTNSIAHPNEAPPYRFIETPAGDLITYTPVTLDQINKNYKKFVLQSAEEYIGIQTPSNKLLLDPNEITGVKIQTEISGNKVSNGYIGILNLGYIKSDPEFLVVFLPLATNAKTRLKDAVENQKAEGKLQTLVGYFPSANIPDLGISMDVLIKKMDTMVNPSYPINVKIFPRLLVVQASSAENA